MISYRTRAGSIITSTIGNPQNGQKTEKKILQRTTEAHLKVQELLNRGNFFTVKRIPVALTYKPQTSRELKKRRRGRRRREKKKGKEKVGFAAALIVLLGAHASKRPPDDKSYRKRGDREPRNENVGFCNVSSREF